MGALLLKSLLMFAAFAGTCDDHIEGRANIQVQRLQLSSGQCFLSIHPMDAMSLIYRDYLFTSDGMMMVFNSFGEGSDNDTTGAREFYFFPRRKAVSEYVFNDKKNELIVSHTDGFEYVFDYNSAQIKSITWAKVKLAKDILPENRGGVEVTNYKGLMLDTGFRRGASPSDNPVKPSTFTDENGKTCSVKNSELFDYSNNNTVFKFNTDKALAAFIKKTCPQLKFTY